LRDIKKIIYIFYFDEKEKKIYLGREGGEKSEIDMSHVTNPIPLSDPSRDKRTRSSFLIKFTYKEFIKTKTGGIYLERAKR